MSSSLKERLSAKKQRIEELKRARENLRMGRSASESDAPSPASPTETRPRAGSTLSVGAFADELVGHVEQLQTALSECQAEKTSQEQIFKEKISSLQEQHAADVQVISKLEDRVAELLKQQEDEAQKRIERVASLAASTDGADDADDSGDTQSGEADKGLTQAESARLAKLQRQWEQQRAEYNLEVTNLQRIVAERDHQLRMLNEEYESRREQWEAVGKLLLGSAAGDEGSGDTSVDLTVVVEERKVLTEEINEMSMLLQDCMSEIGELRAQVSHSRKAQELYEQTLAAYEEENKNLHQNADSLRQQVHTLTKQSELSSVKAQLHESERDVEEQLRAYEQMSKDLKTAKEQLHEMKQSYKDVCLVRDSLQEEIGQLYDQVKAATTEREELEKELERVCLETEARDNELQQIIEEEHAAATVYQKRAADLQAIVNRHEEETENAQEIHATELKDAQMQLEAAKIEAQRAQAQVEQALTKIKDELNKSYGQAESAALAGMSLTELVDELKQDKALLQEKLEYAKREKDEAASKLAEREAMLTEVMNYLKEQDAAAGVSAGGEDSGDAFDQDLGARLRRYNEERQAMLQNLDDLEQEADGLRQENQKLRGLNDSLSTTREALEAQLQAHEAALLDAHNKIKEQEEMLRQVAEFLQTQKGDGDDATQAGAASSGAGMDLSMLDKLEEALNELALERERLLALCQQQKDQLDLLSQEKAGAMQLSQDQLEELQQASLEAKTLAKQVEQLQAKLQRVQADNAALTEERDKLRDKLSELQTLYKDKCQELEALQAEMDKLRAALQATDSELAEAAAAGLSLMEMLEKLKAEHAAEIARLEEENRKLKEELDMYKEGVEKLLAQLGMDGSDVDPDLLAELQARLAQALETQRKLEAMLGMSDEELNKRLEELEQAEAERDALKERIAELEAEIARLKDALADAEDDIKRLSDALMEAAQALMGDQEVERLVASSGGDKGALLAGDAMQKLLDELAARLQDIKEMQEARKQLQQQLLKAQHQVELANMRARDADEEAASLRRMNLQKDARIQQLEQKASLQQRQIASLKSHCDALSRLSERDKETIAQQETLIRRLRQALDAMKSLGSGTFTDTDAIDKIKRLEMQLMSALDKIKDLRAKLRREHEILRTRFLRKWNRNTELCESCGESFDIFKRRHHCRLCGRVLCTECCSMRLETAAQKKPARVCHGCFDFVTAIAAEAQVEAELSALQEVEGTGSKVSDANSANAAGKADLDDDDESDIELELRGPMREIHIIALPHEAESHFGLKLNVSVSESTGHVLSAEVQDVPSGSAAGVAGLQFKDEIVAVDAKPVAHFTKQQLMAVLTRPEAHLTVRSNLRKPKTKANLSILDRAQQRLLMTPTPPTALDRERGSNESLTDSHGAKTPRGAVSPSVQDEFVVVDAASVRKMQAEEQLASPSPLAASATKASSRSRIPSFLRRSRTSSQRKTSGSSSDGASSGPAAESTPMRAKATASNGNSARSATQNQQGASSPSGPNDQSQRMVSSEKRRTILQESVPMSLSEALRHGSVSESDVDDLSLHSSFELTRDPQNRSIDDEPAASEPAAAVASDENSSRNPDTEFQEVALEEAQPLKLEEAPKDGGQSVEDDSDPGSAVVL